VSGYPSPWSLGFIVQLDPGLDAAVEAPRIAAACGFKVSTAAQSSDHFTAVLDLVQLGCVRCDPAVQTVSADAVLFPAAGDAQRSMD
jgi:hypothetical protein